MLRLSPSTETGESPRVAWAFSTAAALAFGACAAATIAWCAPMASMAMPMPGGWTMSMAWMRAPGRAWPAAAASFAGMWTVMMAAMMLPSLLPMLGRYRRAVGADGARLEALTAQVAAAYLAVWALVGLAVYPLGAALATAEMRLPALARLVPFATGLLVMAAGAVQFTAWKARRLCCCRTLPRHGRALRADAATAWRHGLRLGLHCSACCANLTTVLLAIGVMDLRAMAAVTVAITAERFAPVGTVARIVGGTLVGSGLLLAIRATALG